MLAFCLCLEHCRESFHWMIKKVLDWEVQVRHIHFEGKLGADYMAKNLGEAPVRKKTNVDS